VVPLGTFCERRKTFIGIKNRKELAQERDEGLKFGIFK
jgi:hypothetical protein